MSLPEHVRAWAQYSSGCARIADGIAYESSLRDGESIAAIRQLSLTYRKHSHEVLRAVLGHVRALPGGEGIQLPFLQEQFPGREQHYQLQQKVLSLQKARKFNKAWSTLLTMPGSSVPCLMEVPQRILDLCIRMRGSIPRTDTDRNDVLPPVLQGIRDYAVQHEKTCALIVRTYRHLFRNSEACRHIELFEGFWGPKLLQQVCMLQGVMRNPDAIDALLEQYPELLDNYALSAAATGYMRAHVPLRAVQLLKGYDTLVQASSPLTQTLADAYLAILEPEEALNCLHLFADEHEWNKNLQEIAKCARSMLQQENRMFTTPPRAPCKPSAASRRLPGR